jgi:hypothetical protein
MASPLELIDNEEELRERAPRADAEASPEDASHAAGPSVLNSHPVTDCLAHVNLTQLAVRFDPTKAPIVLYDDGNHLILIVSEVGGKLNHNNNKLVYAGTTDSFTHPRVLLVLTDRRIFWCVYWVVFFLVSSKMTYLSSESFEHLAVDSLRLFYYRPRESAQGNYNPIPFSSINTRLFSLSSLFEDVFVSVYAFSSFA